LTPLSAAVANDSSPSSLVVTENAEAEARLLAEQPPKAPPDNRIVIDHSGRKEAGKASIYSPCFDGREMANGKRYWPDTHVAASKTLPLGTLAKVTNLENGRSTRVRIEDRGPFVEGRVVDLTPRAANDIGLTSDRGLTQVIVAPVFVPQQDGSTKLGAGAAEVSPRTLLHGGEEEASNDNPE
jgi:rare lipoprotein A